MATTIANNKANTLIDKPRNLGSYLAISPSLSFRERMHGFSQFIDDLHQKNQFTYHRKVVSPPGPKVTIWDYYEKTSREMLMFA